MMKILIIGKSMAINKAIGDLLKPDLFDHLSFIMPEETLTLQDIENTNCASLIIIDLTSINNTKLFVQQIRQLNQNAIIIAMHLYHEPEFIQPLIEAGASAYLLLNTNPYEIELAIKHAENGQIYITQQAQQ